MKIRLVGHLGEPVMYIGPRSPWEKFIKELKQSGNIIATSNFGENIDVLIANSHSENAIRECASSNVPKSRRILILWEPPIIDHKRHSAQVLQNYGLVYSPSFDWAKNSETKYFLWPQLKLSQKNESLETWAKRKNKSVMVLANKFSATRGELYSLRRKIITITERNSLLDLYGAKWNLGKAYDYRHYFGKLVRTPLKLINYKSITNLGVYHKNYLGLVEDKTKIYQEYRIILVMENSAEYISEKFFDAFEGNAIVIYVGPNNKKYSIPDAAAIFVPHDAQKIRSKITEIQRMSSIEQFQLVQDQQKAILKISDEWYGEKVLSKLAQDINYSIQNKI